MNGHTKLTTTRNLAKFKRNDLRRMVFVLDAQCWRREDSCQFQGRPQPRLWARTLLVKPECQSNSALGGERLRDPGGQRTAEAIGPWSRQTLVLFLHPPRSRASLSHNPALTLLGKQFQKSPFIFRKQKPFFTEGTMALQP